MKWFTTKLSTFYFCLIIISGFFFDQLSKILIVSKLGLGESIDFGIFALHYLQNTGASFSLLPNATDFLTVFSLIVVVVIISCYKKINVKHRLFFALIVSGALGNLLDRIRLGYVIDFLDFKIWPVFNIADTLVFIGAFSLMYVIWKE